MCEDSALPPVVLRPRAPTKQRRNRPLSILEWACHTLWPVQLYDGVSSSDVLVLHASLAPVQMRLLHVRARLAADACPRTGGYINRAPRKRSHPHPVGWPVQRGLFRLDPSHLKRPIQIIFAFLIASSRAGCGAGRSVGARGRAATGTRAPRASRVLQRRAACAARLPTLGPAAHCSTAAALSRDTASPSFRETGSRRAMRA